MFITQVIIIQINATCSRIYFLCPQLLDVKSWLCSKLDKTSIHTFFSQATPVGSIVMTVLSNQLQNNWWVRLKYHGLLIWDQLKSLDAILPWYIYLSHFYRLCSHHRIVCPTFSSTGDLAKTCNDNIDQTFPFQTRRHNGGSGENCQMTSTTLTASTPSTRILVHLWSSIEG